MPAGQPTAGIRAPPALLGAGGQPPVTHHSLAILGTSPADFRARRTCVRMQFGAAQHEVGVHLADLRAVEHQANMLRLRMRAALLQAVDGGLQARLVAIDAQLDASQHLGTEFMTGNIRHARTPWLRGAEMTCVQWECHPCLIPRRSRRIDRR
jgi:hypothetical protein